MRDSSELKGWKKLSRDALVCTYYIKLIFYYYIYLYSHCSLQCIMFVTLTAVWSERGWNAAINKVVHMKTTDYLFPKLFHRFNVSAQLSGGLIGQLLILMFSIFFHIRMNLISCLWGTYTYLTQVSLVFSGLNWPCVSSGTVDLTPNLLPGQDSVILQNEIQWRVH